MWKPLAVAVCATAACLLLAECALRVAGVAAPDRRPDPFFGFAGSPPAWEPVEGPDGAVHMVPRPGKVDAGQSFERDKPPGTLRVFAFGGSSTWGQPYGPGGAFAHWLGRSLRASHPDRTVEVINAGVPGYGSARVRRIVEEAAGYDPDLLVVYTGQNEFRDAAFHAHELTRTPTEAAVLEQAYRSRVLYLAAEGLRVAIARALGPRHTSYGSTHIGGILAEPFSRETFASNDYYSVPELVELPPPQRPRRTPAGTLAWLEASAKRWLGVGWIPLSRQDVLGIFRESVEGMVAAARAADVPIVFVAKTQNAKARDVLAERSFAVPAALRDAATEARWRRAYADGLAALRLGSPQPALRAFEAARAAFDRDDDGLLQLYTGLAHEAAGDVESARRQYARRIAGRDRDLDWVLRDVAGGLGALVVDAHALLVAASGSGVVGYDFFVDRVHPTRHGQRVIGEGLAAVVRARGLLGAGAAAREVRLPDPPPPEETPLLLAALGWSAFHQGRIEQALAHGRSAVEADPDAIQAHLLLGYVYTRLERLEDAERAYSELRRLAGGGEGGPR